MKKLWLIQRIHTDDDWIEMIVFGTEEFVFQQTLKLNELIGHQEYISNIGKHQIETFKDELKELHQTRIQLESLPSRSEFLEKTYKEIMYKIQTREEHIKEIEEHHKLFGNGLFNYKLASSMYSVLIEGENNDNHC